MIVTIMQPYFFPYLGYFQLLECSNIFVILDDVQYIKRAWVNKNRILINQTPYWLKFPVQKASQNLFINQRYYVRDKNERNEILQRIQSAYRKAPHFTETYPLLLEIMKFDSNNVSGFNTNLIRQLTDFLGIECQILLSSELEKDNSLKGQDRIIEINRHLGSSHYVNPIGGISLYREQDFFEYELKLSFLQPENIQYPQFKEPFVPFLSIIDVLMFCALNEVRKFLKQYRLLQPSEIEEKNCGYTSTA
jgi:hypothetical protein